MEIFQIENLSFAYPTSPDKLALNHVTLSIHPGEYIALCGRSGSGKSTLLRHLKTVLTPSGKRAGRVLFDGVPLEAMDMKSQAARIGYVMQDPDSQIVTDQVWHELAFGLESLGCDQKTMRLRVAEMASYFGVQDWFHRNISELSGGQKQLLNLASVMAMQPEVLILDEPTSQLDPIAASDFLNTVRKINQELGTTVILTEHRLEDVLHGADRMIVMEKGRVTAFDAPRRVGRQLHRENSPMFAAMPAPMQTFYGAGERGENCPLTVREGRTWLTARFAGRTIDIPRLPEEPELPDPREPALEVKDVWFRYERNSPDILRGVNLKLAPGTLHCIVGSNGAGKSTLMKTICGICRPYRGRVKIGGKPLDACKGKELFVGNLCMLPQDPRNLFVKETLLDDLLEMLPAGSGAEDILETAKLCEVDQLLESHPYDLSGGEQQRGALAKVLLTSPKLLLLDEPTKGLDHFFKKTFAGILEKLKSRGVTILMVSHDVEFCAAYADAVSMFFDGQILTTNTPRRFFEKNSFYTTAANRMSRHVFSGAVTAENVIALIQRNGEG